MVFRSMIVLLVFLLDLYKYDVTMSVILLHFNILKKQPSKVFYE